MPSIASYHFAADLRVVFDARHRLILQDVWNLQKSDHFAGIKPDSVSRFAPGVVHLSESAEADSFTEVKRSIPGTLRTGRPVPYFALHRMGFILPLRLLATRWSLKPPFHPYPSTSSGQALAS